jgi:hypothetical protein
MLRVIFFFCGIIFVAGFVSGCSDEPNSVGKGLLSPKDHPKVVSMETTAVGGSNYLVRVSGNLSRLLVGRSQSYEAVTLLQFSHISPLRSSDSLTHAELKFSIVYRFPDTLGIIGIEARKFPAGFNQSTFTWDSLAVSPIGRKIGGLSDSLITPRDSSFRIPLDTSYIREITQNGSGSLVLSSSSTTRLVIGLDNYRDFLGPKLVITVYDSLADSSVTIEYNTSQGVFVANGSPNTQAGRLTIQPGIATRCLLQFDITKIPKSASITHATMIVRLDTTSSLRSMFATNLLYSNLVFDSTSPPRIGGVTAASTSLNDSLGAYFQFDVKNILQQWVIGRPNYGIVLRPSEELIGLDRYVVYGANAPYALRPKLLVKYTVVP